MGLFNFEMQHSILKFQPKSNIRQATVDPSFLPKASRSRSDYYPKDVDPHYNFEPLFWAKSLPIAVAR